MKIKFAVSAAVALAAIALQAPAAGAVSFPATSAISTAASSTFEPVQYRRYGNGGDYYYNGGYYGRGYGDRRYYGRRRGNGAAIGLGIAGAIIGGAIIADEVRRSGGGSGSGEARCERTYRSYDSDTGNYTGYDGEIHRCPYL